MYHDAAGAADLIVTNSSFEHNIASSGGSIQTDDNEATITGCTFAGGQAVSRGGHLELAGSSVAGGVVVANNTFSNGNGGPMGGAVSSLSGTNELFEGNTFVSCNAANGGGPCATLGLQRMLTTCLSDAAQSSEGR